jgi:uncharacterized membrane protein YfcA
MRAGVGCRVAYGVLEPTFQFADVDAAALALVAFAAFAASILGGLSGYGTGLVLPAFVAPVVGVANVIPVMAVGMAINNGSRVAAFWREVAWPDARRLLLFGLPACMLGAYGYTLLPTRWIAFAIGAFLVVSVPLRRLSKRAAWRLGPRGEAVAGAFFGVIDGAMTGTGVLLISILMAAGVTGASLIATDAIVSLVMGVAKIATFGTLARLDAELALAGLAIGACTTPGAFVARWLLKRIPARIHASFMEAVVLAGGAAFLWRGVAGAG